ncbi:MAG: hypothetical protein H0V98_03920 [Chloroflexia bacterium]|nr:hypothetical protein [Chloroflexia bacterium]
MPAGYSRRKVRRVYGSGTGNTCQTTVTVTSSDVNPPSSPSLEGEPIPALQQGQVLVVTGPAVEADGFVWLPVSDPSAPNLTGFAAADFLTPQP